MTTATEDFFNNPENRKQILTELLDHVENAIHLNEKGIEVGNLLDTYREGFMCPFIINKIQHLIPNPDVYSKNLHILIPELENGSVTGSIVWYNDGDTTPPERNILRRNNIIQALNKLK